jgi:hypothetical protein
MHQARASGIAYAHCGVSSASSRDDSRSVRSKGAFMKRPLVLLISLLLGVIAGCVSAPSDLYGVHDATPEKKQETGRGEGHFALLPPAATDGK